MAVDWATCRPTSVIELVSSSAAAARASVELVKLYNLNVRIVRDDFDCADIIRIDDFNVGNVAH